MCVCVCVCVVVLLLLVGVLHPDRVALRLVRNRLKTERENLGECCTK